MSIVKEGSSGKYSQADRIRRLINTYVLKKGTVKLAWSYPAAINEVRLYSANLLDGYFLDYSRDADYPGPRDNLGVPLIDYTGDVGVRYNPWYVGHYALACYERYKRTQDRAYLGRFLRQADWFIENAALRDGEFSVWEYNFQWSHLLVSPWISSLAQSVAISTLLRAWLISRKQRYLDVAGQAFLSFTKEISEGGVKHVLPDGTVTFEESAVLPPTTVLNGFIFSIWGIYEFLLTTKEPLAATLVEQSVSGLRQLLPAYDMGIWSKYDLCRGGFGLPAIASVFYHNIHIAQLKVMADLFADDLFERYACRWETCEANHIKRTAAIMLKAVHKVLNY